MAVSYKDIEWLVKQAESDSPYSMVDGTATPLAHAGVRFDEYMEGKDKKKKDGNVGSVNEVPNPGFPGNATGVQNEDRDNNVTTNLSMPEFEGKQAAEAPSPAVGTPEYEQWLKKQKIASRGITSGEALGKVVGSPILGEVGSLATSLIPGVGSVQMGADALTELARHNYGSAALNAVGAVPFGGVVTKPLKWIGKGMSKIFEEVPDINPKFVIPPALRYLDDLDDVGRIYLNWRRDQEQKNKKPSIQIPEIPIQTKQADEIYNAPEMPPLQPQPLSMSKGMSKVQSVIERLRQRKGVDIGKHLTSNPDLLHRLLKGIGYQHRTISALK